MPCTRLEVNGHVTIVCGRGGSGARCSICTRPGAGFLCDGPKPEQPSGTCDVALCGRCRVRAGQGTDYCPSCAAALGMGLGTQGALLAEGTPCAP